MGLLRAHLTRETKEKMSTNNRATLIRELLGVMGTTMRRMENILDRNDVCGDPEDRLSSDEFDELLDSAMRALQLKMDSTNIKWEKARDDDERETREWRERIATYAAMLAASADSEFGHAEAWDSAPAAAEAAPAPAAAGAGPAPPVEAVERVPAWTTPAIVRDGQVMLCATPSGPGWVCEAVGEHAASWRRE